ncbi:MAG: response regulator, partial [Acidobacteria bacterium]|nr:response regulator [Acidobacteriota bacterium]
MPETFRSLIEEPSSSPASLRRKQKRLVQLHTRLIPGLRVIGFLLLSLGLMLHNWILPGSTSRFGLWGFLGLSLTYCGVSWLCLYRFYDPRSRFDLALLFLGLDLVFLTMVVYLTGGESSWLFFILLARVADQTTAGFRRSLLFAHLVPMAYEAMLLYIVIVDGRAISPGFALAMFVFLYGAGVYMALTSRPNDRRRRRAAEAVAIGRELIQKLRRQSEELTEAKGRAEAATVAKSQFLNNSSHELRTPLNGILGLLEMLRDSGLTAKQLELLESARGGASKLLGTLDDIIDYSALEDASDDPEAIPTQVSRVDVRLLVGSCLEVLRETAAEKGISLSSRIEPGTPQSFFSDSASLRRILLNLVGNAVKFGDTGTVKVAVRREGGAALRFEVQDCGAGIPEADRELIFEPFTQLDGSVRRRQSGTGLGLALSKVLVKRLGGEIGVEDGPDGGSVFWFTVEDHRMGSPERPQEGATLLPPETRVLVVEDDPINQKITYHQLLGLGVQAEVANNGVEALERLSKGRFDLVLMDVQMPELDGYAATQELRRREGAGPRTPVIALTAHA